MDPKDDVTVCAEALFYHGQGDYAERYIDVLHPLTERGIRCIVTELPGHGRSPGRRGHCGNVELLDSVIQNTLETMNELPYGVMGHSMGGLLAARHLVLAGQGKLPKPSFAWLSSPLLSPGNGKSILFLKMLPLLAPWMPSFTVSTGVKPEMCRVKSDTGDGAVVEVSTERPKHQLWHNRVSLGWGADLLDFEKIVRQGLDEIPADIPLLYTQGSGDTVCPPALARELFKEFPNQDKQYHELEGLLHEPFRGDGSDQLFAALEAWLDDLDLNQGQTT
jgi:alpha-beta hydrolase superfamily lysophospholipase